MDNRSVEITLDEERQATAREYARVSRRLLLLELVIGGTYLVLWLAAGWYLDLRQWIESLVGAPAVVVALFLIGFGLPYLFIDLLLSYYSGFILPHRYGQSNQTFGSWLTDQVKGLVLSGILGLGLLEIVYWLLRIAPDWWWLYAAVVMLLFTVILSNLAPVLILPLFYTFTPLEDEELSHRLVALAEQARAQVKGVFRFDMSTRTKSANAALTGLGSTRRIVLGDTLLDEFTPDEIEAILAHELGHHVHRDVALGIVVNSALTVVSFWVGHLALRWSVNNFGLNGIADPAGIPVLALVTSVLGLVAMPLGNAYSRWRERMADHYALEATGKPEAFAAAMTRLANQNLADTEPERWVVLLLHSHPPIHERIAAANDFAAR